MHGHGLRFKILLLLLTPLLALLTEGQVKIHGKITDSEGKPVEFATVRIGGTIIGTTSGLEGDYSLSCPAADTIHIHFSCIGYREATRALIDAKGDVTLNMRLQLSTEMLQQVEVTELKKQTGSVGKIDATELRKSPDVQGGSVESLITTMAGVTGSNEMSAQYSVRGGSYDENSVYINGIEVYRPQLITSGQQEGLSIINPDLVGSIGFSTGGFPAEYGDKMSSVLDTASPSHSKARSAQASWAVRSPSAKHQENSPSSTASATNGTPRCLDQWTQKANTTRHSSTTRHR